MFGELTHGTDGNDDIRENIVIYVKNIALFVVAFMLLYYSVRRLIPEDLFSSALYYDGLGLQKVFAQPAMLVDDPLSVFIMTVVMGFSFPNVSAAAFSVGFMLFLVQIWAGYKSSVAGGYTRKSKTLLGFISNIINKEDSLDPKTLNWGKVNWLLAWIFIAFADTFTDVSYRSGDDPALFWQSVFVSVLVYNILSEWAMLTGLIGVMNYGYVVAVDTAPVLYHSFILITDEFNKVRQNAGGSPLKGRPSMPSSGNDHQRNGGGKKQKNRGNQQGNRGGGVPPHIEPRQRGGNRDNVTIVTPQERGDR